jgi:hypothetical protein
MVEMFEEFVKRQVCQTGEEWHSLPQTKIFENRKTFRTVVLSTFSSDRSPNQVLTPLKKCSKLRSEMFFGKDVSASLGDGYLKKCSKRRSEMFFGKDVSARFGRRLLEKVLKTRS